MISAWFYCQKLNFWVEILLNSKEKRLEKLPKKFGWIMFCMNWPHSECGSR